MKIELVKALAALDKTAIGIASTVVVIFMLMVAVKAVQTLGATVFI